MAREPRIEYEGAFYHVLSRGDRGEAIFHDVGDRALFVDRLGEACEKTGWLVHAYVLMPNHYHLLLETPEANLVAGMKWFQGTYTQKFNRRHQLSGHVFQGRYKALIIDDADEQYFECVATYIHLNPARARLIDPRRGLLQTYPWSSYPSYLSGRRGHPKWLRADRVLGSLDLRDSPGGRKQYEQYVAGRVAELTTKKGREALDRQWKAVRRGWCLGSEEFQQRMLSRVHGLLAGRRHASYGGEAIRKHDQQEAQRLLSAGMAELQVTPAELQQRAKSDLDKQLLAWLLRKHTTAANRWISEKLHMGHISNVSNSVRRIDQSKRREIVSFRKRVERILII